jgi:chemotaxis protein CheX
MQPINTKPFIGNLIVMTTTLASSSLTAEYVNPVIFATKNVFEMMLDCTPTRKGLRLKTETSQTHEISAVIGISGNAAGTVVVSLSKTAACEVLKRMVGIEADDITNDVCDAVGELTNMIAGQAKAQLAKYELSISIPNVVSGLNHVVHFPSNVQPMVLEFDSEIGPLTIEVAFSAIS